MSIVRCRCGKVGYAKRGTAELEMARLRAKKYHKPRKALSVYRCQESGRWHVGHDPRIVKKLRAKARPESQGAAHLAAAKKRALGVPSDAAGDAMRLLDRLLRSLRCALGRHAEAVRDQTDAGRRVLRCPRCWRVSPYPAVEPQRLAALRAEQAAQAAELSHRLPRRSRALRLIR